MKTLFSPWLSSTTELPPSLVAKPQQQLKQRILVFPGGTFLVVLPERLGDKSPYIWGFCVLFWFVFFFLRLANSTLLSSLLFHVFQFEVGLGLFSHSFSYWEVTLRSSN